MNIFSRYNYSYIKNKKSRLPLVVLSVFIAVTIFTLITAVPIVIKNYTKETSRSIYGNSDIYLLGSNDNKAPITSIYHMPETVKADSEYIVHGFAIQGLYNYNEKTSSATIVGVNLDELNLFNKPSYAEGNPTKLGLNEVIINKALADSQNISVGLDCELVFLEKPYKLKVVGISENEGLFKIKSQNLIVVSKQTMRGIVGIAIPVEDMFNICMIKLKDNSLDNVNANILDLKKAYPDWNIGNSSEELPIDNNIKISIAPMIVCGAVVAMFALYVFYLVLKTLQKTNLVEFSSQVFLSRSKQNDYKNLVVQSMFYGGASALASTMLMYSIFELALNATRGYMFQNVGLVYFLSTGLFGILVSLGISLLPVGMIKNSNSMFMNKPKLADKKSLFYHMSVVVAVFILSVLVATIQPKGRVEWLSLVLFVLAVITSLIIFPHVIRFFVLWLNKSVKNKAVDIDYRRKQSFLYNSLLYSTRIILASLLMIVFIFTTTQTIQKNLVAEAELDNYSISIENINDGKGAYINQKLKNLEIVKRTYETTSFYDIKFYLSSQESEIKTLRGMNVSDIKHLYSKNILGDKNSVFEKLYLEENYILLSSYYCYINNINIDDKITLEVPVGNEKKLINFTVAGFVETPESSHMLGITNIHTINNITNTNRSNAILISVNVLDADKLSAYVKAEFGDDYIVNSSFENKRLILELTEVVSKIFYYFNLIISALVVVFIPLSLFMDIEKVSSELNHLNYSGKSKKKLIIAYILQQSFVLISSIFISFIILKVFSTAIENMYLLSGGYTPIFIPWQRLVVVLGIVAVITIVGTIMVIFTRIKSYTKKSSI